jgi:flagellar basal-body rod modification protein FlgD
MVASVTSSSSVNNTTALSSATSGAGQTSAQEQSDRFLKLLVAQLNNQDPMNPMDNAQMTSQMAQINTVSGIQQLNDTMKSMNTQFTSMQVIQGSSMIGHEVLTAGSQLTMTNGVGKAAIDLSGNADNVSVQVLSAGGQLLDTLNLGSMSTGTHNFEWNPSSYTGVGNPTFKVTASSGGKAISATPLARNTVTSISSDANGMNLSLQGGATVSYGAIKAIL